MTVLSLVNLVPITKIVRGFGYLALLCAIITVGLFIAAALWNPFTPTSPWAAYVRHQVDATSSNLQLYDAQHLNFQDKITPKVMVEAGIDRSQVNCSWGVCWVWNVPGTTIAPLSLTMNVSNGHFLATIVAPDAYLFQIIINGPVQDVSINTQKIDRIYKNNFVYHFRTDNPWLLDVTPNATSDSIPITIQATYAQRHSSLALDQIINRLPEWATFSGHGEGALVVTTEHVLHSP